MKTDNSYIERKGSCLTYFLFIFLAEQQLMINCAHWMSVVAFQKVSPGVIPSLDLWEEIQVASAHRPNPLWFK
jgi:hypothetical protein